MHTESHVIKDTIQIFLPLLWRRVPRLVLAAFKSPISPLISICGSFGLDHQHLGAMAPSLPHDEETSLITASHNSALKNHTRDVHILSLAFLLIILAYGAAQNLQSTLNTVRTSLPFAPSPYSINQLNMLCFKTDPFYVLSFFHYRNKTWVQPLLGYCIRL